MTKILFSLLIIFLTPTPTQAQTQIIINEVFPAPTQDKEWIELYNPSTQEVKLTDWLLEDQLSSPATIFAFTDQTIPAQELLVVELPSAKLNNSADGVTLKDSAAAIIDQMSYPNSKTDYSWSRDSLGNWQLTPPTKNSSNTFPSPTPYSTPLPTPTPSPLLSPSPASTPTSIAPIITTPATTPTPTQTPILPSPPLPLYQPQQLILTSRNTTLSAQTSQRSHLITRQLPHTALLSVILGGSWLLVSSSWKIHAHISSQKSSSQIS